MSQFHVERLHTLAALGENPEDPELVANGRRLRETAANAGLVHATRRLDNFLGLGTS